MKNGAIKTLINDLKREVAILHAPEESTTPRWETGYYVEGKDGGYTDGSPYRYRESAINEAKEIHGSNYADEFLSEHITEVFYWADKGIDI